MIKNEKQYQNTVKHLNDFRNVLADYESNRDGKDLLIQLEMNALKSKIEKFEAEIAEYQNVKRGILTTVSLHTLDNLPEVLIKARIAQKLTHAMLAERVGLKEQQIQKYEATEYAGASVARLQLIIDALELYITPTTVRISKPKFDTDAIPGELLKKAQYNLMAGCSLWG